MRLLDQVPCQREVGPTFTSLNAGDTLVIRGTLKIRKPEDFQKLLNKTDITIRGEESATILVDPSLRLPEENRVGVFSFNNCPGLRIRNLRFRDDGIADNETLKVSKTVGVELRKCSGAIIESCDFENWSEAAIFLFKTGRVTVRGCNVDCSNKRRGLAYGIVVREDSSALIERVYFQQYANSGHCVAARDNGASYHIRFNTVRLNGGEWAFDVHGEEDRLAGRRDFYNLVNIAPSDVFPTVDQPPLAPSGSHFTGGAAGTSFLIERNVFLAPLSAQPEMGARCAAIRGIPRDKWYFVNNELPSEGILLVWAHALGEARDRFRLEGNYRA